MKITVKPILRPLDLGGKAEEYAGQTITVWINPTLAFLSERDELLIEWAKRQQEAEKARVEKSEQAQALSDALAAWVTGEFADQVHTWFARLWSQGEPSTYWTLDEIKQLQEVDYGLVDWMKNQSIRMIRDYRIAEKKS